MKKLFLLLLLIPLTALAEINFITLKHRSAESIIPVLQPVVDEDIRLSGRHATLIINSKPWQLEELRVLVTELDTPLQSLIITVSQGDETTQSVIYGDVSGTLEQPRVRVYGTEKARQQAVTQQLRVIEGHWATIRVGESVPIPKQSTVQTPYSTSVQRSIEYKDIDSGFQVRPYLRGDIVTLDIRPFLASRSKHGGGVIEQQEVDTTVTGRVGEWLTIGGSAEQQDYSGLGTVYSTGKKRDLTRDIKLKVETIPSE